MKTAGKKVVTLVVGVIVSLLVIVGIFSCVKVIPAGHVGVVYNMNGGVEDRIRPQGWHLIPPTKKLTLYSIATQQVYLSADSREGSPSAENFSATCKDGLVDVDLEMSYHIPVEKVTAMFNKYAGISGEKVVNTFIRGKLKTYVSEVTSKYSVLDVVMDKKGEVNSEITIYLGQKLQEFGLEVESANLSRTTPSAEVQQAINERSQLAQQIEVERKRQEKLEIEAENKKIEAQGEAAKKLIEANNEAEMQRIDADATAYENQVLSNSITDQLIRKMEAEARQKFGWVTIQGAGNTIVNAQEEPAKTNAQAESTQADTAAGQ